MADVTLSAELSSRPLASHRSSCHRADLPVTVRSTLFKQRLDHAESRAHFTRRITPTSVLLTSISHATGVLELKASTVPAYRATPSSSRREQLSTDITSARKSRPIQPGTQAMSHRVGSIILGQSSGEGWTTAQGRETSKNETRVTRQIFVGMDVQVDGRLIGFLSC